MQILLLFSDDAYQSRIGVGSAISPLPRCYTVYHERYIGEREQGSQVKVDVITMKNKGSDISCALTLFLYPTKTKARRGMHRYGTLGNDIGVIGDI